MCTDTFQCDGCGHEALKSARHVAVAERPSNGELVEVLWFCPECGFKYGLPLHSEAPTSIYGE